MKVILEKNIIDAVALTMAVMLYLMKALPDTTKIQPVNASSANLVATKPCTIEDTPNTTFFY